MIFPGRGGTLTKQECIPVGCVPPTAVAICWGVLPQFMLGSPPRFGPGDPRSCGPGNPPPRPDSPTSPRVWAWRPARHAGIPPHPVDRRTCVETYPSQTSFAGGNKLADRSKKNSIRGSGLRLTRISI